MAVDTTHPEYRANEKTWKRIEDCLGGADVIQNAGELYLPRLSEQSLENYNKYKGRALFFNATRRTHEAMMGFLFRKPPQFQGITETVTEGDEETEVMSAEMQAFMADADMAGTPFLAYARKVAATQCGTGRGVTVVDWSEGENRPYFAFYPALCVRNWRTRRVGGNLKLSLLVLSETIYPEEVESYDQTAVTRYRIYRLNTDGQCEIRTFDVQGTAIGIGGFSTITTAPGTGPAPGPRAIGQLGESAPVVITRKGKPLEFIPAVFHNSDNPGESIGNAPLGDISAVNVSQYRTSADLEHGRHVCGLPTPWAKCFGSNDKLFMGATYAWTTDDKDAECGILEFTGQGLGALEKAMEEKTAQMAALGARIIEPRKADSEAYDTVALRASAETSTLARISLLCSETLSQALRIAVWWAGTDEDPNTEIRFIMNKDFVSAKIPPQMITAIVAAYQSGSISFDAMFFAFQQGELYPDGHTAEKERDLIDANPPAMLASMMAGPEGGGGAGT